MDSLRGTRMAVVSFSAFPGDPRPRRAAEAFRDAGVAVEVICLREDDAPKREFWSGIQVDRVGIRKSRDSKLWYLLQYGVFILVAFLRLAGRSATKRYQFVHVHNMPDVLVFAALIPKCLGAKVLLDLHDPMPELMMTIFGATTESRAVRWMVRLERWSIGFADLVVTVNRACERLFTSRGCPAEKLCVVMNSPDERIFPYSPAQVGRGATADRGGSFVIMYHGTIVERNGLDLAVEALQRVRQSVPGAELRIYGARTPFLDEVMQSAAAKGLDTAVRYLGPKRLEELGEAIRSCDVGVIPNRRSIFTEINTPTRIFEYLALGRPVVAPRAPGIRDYFEEDDLVYFSLGDVDDLAAKLAWVATHPREAGETTLRGQMVYREHTWSEERQRLLRAASRLMDATGGRA
jgi:glycosyltransferase involved in cell wall biosynthesis